MKQCKTCKEEKPLSEFYTKERKTGYKETLTKCIECMAGKPRQRNTRNGERKSDGLRGFDSWAKKRGLKPKWEKIRDRNNNIENLSL